MKKFLIILALLIIPQFASADVTTGLVGWWTMDKRTSPGTSTTTDMSGNGNEVQKVIDAILLEFLPEIIV